MITHSARKILGRHQSEAVPWDPDCRWKGAMQARASIRPPSTALGPELIDGIQRLIRRPPRTQSRGDQANLRLLLQFKKGNLERFFRRHDMIVMARNIRNFCSLWHSTLPSS